MKKILTLSVVALFAGVLCAGCGEGRESAGNTDNTVSKMEEQLNLTQEWDKVFPKSGKVTHSKITFHNRYGVTLAADLYIPKNTDGGKLPAIAVCGPFGAVKEQASGLYAQTLAERGFLTIAFDPSFTGESGGQPRYVASPDINTEDFCAAVDYLSTREDVDPERIGILGICGWGGMAVNAAAMDTRIKATVASTMYDMSRATANGYFDAADNAEARNGIRRQLNAQRTEDYCNGSYALAGGVVDPLPDDARSLLRTTMPITRRHAAITSARSTQTVDGTGHRPFLSSTCLFWHMPVRYRVQFCWFMVRMHIPAISARTPIRNCRATTRNSS